MRSSFLFIVLPFILLTLLADNSLRNHSNSTSVPQSDVFRCAPAADGSESSSNGRFMIPLPGWGTHHYTISTKNDSAQFYFDQGLNMYYSYHWREANASFKEAARFDPNCAMAYWGQALARGPAYNSAHSYVMSKDIPVIVEKMNSLRNGASDKEKELIDAMTTRYSADVTDKERKKLNAEYSKNMQELVTKYPGDPDITAIYIDAVMLEHPWNFWNNDGTAKPWTEELVRLCEKVLEMNARHPGGLHYYIHVTEASRDPGRAVRSADVLKDELPGVAHMVHMSSHVYERNGSYEKGVNVNEKADQDLVVYDSLLSDVTTLSLSRHVPHYFAVQTYCAITGAMYTKGLPLAFRLRKSVSPSYENTYQQHLYMMPVMAWVRMGKWEEIINDREVPPEKWTYASLLHDFAKGLAFVNTGEPVAARRHLKELQRKSKDPILKKVDTPFNSPSQGAYIAENILSASILFHEKKYNDAIEAMNRAIRMEDSLIYIEPKDWLIPARQFLGAHLMKLRGYGEAESVYRKDLEWNPGNGWSLLGLCQSLEAQGRIKEADAYRADYLKSFSAADEIPPGSVYLK